MLKNRLKFSVIHLSKLNYIFLINYFRMLINISRKWVVFCHSSPHKQSRETSLCLLFTIPIRLGNRKHCTVFCIQKHANLYPNSIQRVGWLVQTVYRLSGHSRSTKWTHLRCKRTSGIQLAGNVSEFKSVSVEEASRGIVKFVNSYK